MVFRVFDSLATTKLLTIKLNYYANTLQNMWQ